MLTTVGDLKHAWYATCIALLCTHIYLQSETEFVIASLNISFHTFHLVQTSHHSLTNYNAWCVFNDSINTDVSIIYSVLSLFLQHFTILLAETQIVGQEH